jgi:hypothetical protein
MLSRKILGILKYVLKFLCDDNTEDTFYYKRSSCNMRLYITVTFTSLSEGVNI